MSDTKLQSISEIFNNKIFRIPDFQRGYAWGEQQLNDFWDDIQNLSEDRIHYIGLLTVEPVHREKIKNSEKWVADSWLFKKGISAYYVIDGQQRLTTIIILLNEILNKLDENGEINYGKKSEWTDRFLYHSFNESYKSFIFGYEKDNPSDEFFKTKILGQKSSSADKFPETLYTANLLFAKEYFCEKIKFLNDADLENIFNKVTNKLKFNYYEIGNDLDVYITFETMNNRGKSLSHLELLKNRLIYLSTLIDKDEDINRLRIDINETWKTIYEYLGKNKNNPLDDDDFLLNHWIMYFTYDRSQSNAYAEFLLKKKFTVKNVLTQNVSFKEIKDYIDSLGLCVKAWFYLYNIQYSDYSEEIKEWIKKLNRLGMGAFPPMAMAVLTKEKNEETIIKILKACEKFNFLVFSISRHPSNTQNTSLYRSAREYYHGLTTIEKVTENISKLTNEWSDPEMFKSHILELFTKYKKEGFYAWNGLKYFLYEYELFLQNKSNAKVTWEDFNKRVKEDTIEHIYPQSGTDKYWQTRFGRMSETEQNFNLNSLGNLLLLSRSKNSKLQNYSFDEKKHLSTNDSTEIGYFNGSFSEIEVCGYAEWTTTEIEERGLKMLSFMENRWNFKFQDKLEVLMPKQATSFK